MVFAAKFALINREKVFARPEHRHSEQPHLSVQLSGANTFWADPVDRSSLHVENDLSGEGPGFDGGVLLVGANDLLLFVGDHCRRPHRGQ